MWVKIYKKIRDNDPSCKSCTSTFIFTSKLGDKRKLIFKNVK